MSVVNLKSSRSPSGWELYDTLLAGMEQADAVVEEIIVGEAWTGVIAGGHMGVAMTVRQPGPQASFAPKAGQTLRETAEAIRSWKLEEASIGMAAINCFYNHVNRFRGGAGKDVFYENRDLIKGKTVATIGHFPLSLVFTEAAKELYILERVPSDGDYPDSACEYLLPTCDVVFVTGSSLINKTVTRLLQLAGGAVILTGPSVPMAEELLDFGITELAGFCVSDVEAARQTIIGNSCRGIFRTGQMINMNESIRRKKQ
ncbi:MAG: DUF364 domain-containing protein [Lachnospiraceae bacterium]|nr:DUF364 domain-containing protein [Lachnospiraceae bacterium]MDY5742132.1 DUF364 domain-containing protein [Lachnospiraceae bacterium]